MAVTLRQRLARAAPVGVFAAAGVGAGLGAVELAAHPGLRLVSSPRHATVLVAVGRFPGAMGAALARVHDQLPHPRGVVWCPSPGEAEGPAALRGAARAVGLADASGSAAELGAALALGLRDSSDDALPDVPPNPFAGRGDHGQGGEGMMGGVPWGRPMAMTGPDRDGLALDRLPARLGPFLIGLPPGLAVDVVLQGGVVQEASAVALGGDQPYSGAEDGPGPTLRHHTLRWVAESCRLGGLDALAARCARLAARAAQPAAAGVGEDLDASVARLARVVRRTGLVSTWRRLGDEGAAADRLAGRLRCLEEGRPVETGGPEQRTEDDPVPGLGSRLVGLDWSDALVVVHSLDLVGRTLAPEARR